ncbi:MAG: hypothetical protein EOO68_22055 [Moraxellaceae bacterium]|nr:MAG: hypothetical protein EOO68_22055 [Moraxellaceae bacterium]
MPPPITTTFAFLNYKYERIITNLRQYLSRLEQFNHAHLALPSYNTDPEWVSSNNHARRFHDYACAILILACNSIGISAFYVLYPLRFSESYWVLIVVGMVALLTAGLHWFLPRFGYKLD